MVTARNGLCAAYLGTVIIFFVGSFFPDSRLWGVAAWGYYSLSIRLLAVVVALAIPALVVWRTRSGGDSHILLARQTWAPAAVMLALVFAAAFYFGRSTTHFLGDGYTALANLASDNPILKDRGLGEGLVHLAVARWVGEPSDTAALVSYQSISICSGFALVMIVLWSAGKMFKGTVERLLFSLGCLTGGYMLLYFGYVENYSLFVLSVLVFAVLGVLISRNLLPRWLIAVPAAASVFFHIFGIALIPAAAYLLVAERRLGRFTARMPLSARLLVAIALLLVLCAGMFALYEANYFFRIALLTPIGTAFTVGGYTLFSLAHLTDMMSLLLLLSPVLVLTAMLLTRQSVRQLFGSTEFRFLSVMTACSLLTVFMFDPKLGMPRDWDLFSFAGVPLTLTFYLLLLDSRTAIDRRLACAAGAIVVSALVLAARVGIQVTPPLALQQISHYITLDPIKGKHAIIFLIDYHKRHGNAAELTRWEHEWQQYPDVQLLAQADSLLQHDDVVPAVALLEKAAASNPMSATAYAYLGSANVRVGRCKEALEALRIAEGLSPHSMQVHIGLGYAYYCLGDVRRAEQAFRTASRLGPDKAEPYFALAQYYKQLVQPGKYHEYLAAALKQADASAPMWAELGDHYLARRRFDKAAEAYKRGLMRGLDTAVVMNRIRSHPELFAHFRR